MSRGSDYDERDGQEPEIPDSPIPRHSSSAGSGAYTNPANVSHHTRTQDQEGFLRRRTTDREASRTRGSRYDLSARERDVLRDIGRFRTIATDDLLKHRYSGQASAMRKELIRLQQQGLLQKRSISVGKNRNTLYVVALTREGARLARQDEKLPEDQAVYAGFVKPAEVPHDAAIYQMYQAEAQEIEARGDKIRRVVLDYEFKKEVYSKLGRDRPSSALEYVRRQQEAATEQHLPIVDGRIALPDLRIEYETPEGDLDRVDLELATEHYHRGHMDTKARAGFKMYGFISTSRGRRAQWEGRELSATVLSL